MRVASNQYHISVTSALQKSNSELDKAMTQLASGLRLTKPSDDPVSHVRLSRLERDEASIKQYKENISSLQNRLTKNEDLLSSMSTNIMQIRDIVVWSSNGVNTPDDLVAQANELKALRDNFFYSANFRDDEGRYIFSGTVSGTQTVAYDSTAAVGSRYTFQGNTESQMVVIGKSVTQSVNVSMDDAAGFLNKIDAAIEAMLAPGATPDDPAVRSVINAAFNSTDDILTSVSTKITRLGGIQNIISALDTDHSNLSLSNKQAQVDIGNVDYAEASIRMNSLTAAIQATQKAYGRVSSLSLFDVL